MADLLTPREGISLSSGTGSLGGLGVVRGKIIVAGADTGQAVSRRRGGLASFSLVAWSVADVVGWRPCVDQFPGSIFSEYIVSDGISGCS
jgi:hypothetical protein